MTSPQSIRSRLRPFRRALREPWIAHRLAMLGFHRLVARKELVRRRLAHHDVTMCLDLADEGLSRDLYLYGSREDHATRQLVSCLRPGQTIIDIGANLGYFALIEACYTQPGGKIYAIEPAPRNVEILRKNVAVNGWNDIIDVTHGAVSDSKGTATLHLSRRSNLHTLGRVECMDNYTSFTGTCDVPMFTLDEFADEKGIPLSSISLIRMDIEGYEVEAIAGMKRILAAGHPLTMFVEIHPKLVKERKGERGYHDFLDSLSRTGLEIVGGAASLSSRVDSEIKGQDWTALRDAHEAVELFLQR